ncbi:carboxymuconolactone decarboxylase family protein [Terrilactibacillus laevilacticus]|uniref:carboxymuconolactone decarboxylase family protein n=1 Tax=Terrilactibacillus laevilacticus TaxID=1380157 RepID=UPI001146B72F|nr:carboxymuconolactone decarboxylase family protein [Terrilactibacillus laevilacticus]
MVKNPAFEEFKKEFPESGSLFGELFNTVAGKALNEKTKQLIYLGILTTLRYAPAIRVHIHKALEAGATKEEIQEAMMLTIPAGGLCSFLAVFPDVKDELHRKA